jgi:glycosyltransferase involved in cell wall biosynthesis
MCLTRDSRNVDWGVRGKFKSTLQSIYSRSSSRELERMLDNGGADLLHAHNLYPLLSPAILKTARRRHIPVLLHCQNFRLACPIEYQFRKGKPCDKCATGRFYRCVRFNCRGNAVESIVYSMQNYSARAMGIMDGLVNFHIAPTPFVYRRLLDLGIPGGKVVVLPNPILVPPAGTDPSQGRYIAFAGRHSPEKGLAVLLAAAQRTGLPVHVAGDCPAGMNFGGNVTRRGFLHGEALAQFYQGARFLVVPSLWYETFGLVAAEAMSHGLPVIASRIGALSDVVDDGKTGWLFTPGDVEELAQKMTALWHQPELSRQLGSTGREKVIREYSLDVYYNGLSQLYKQAMGA